ncbi:MAG: MgtC/SapB family protein [Clostridiales bacterium]|nr:MgtC/SapB family protein [Clostridiales bacterium]
MDYLGIILRLIISALAGALIGLEREHKNMPAGLRTNILVCMGSALVQIVNIEIFKQYRGITNVDPARFGAQVISGIGFLGAGTIIREGASIKGLTTAAGLWVVACIGIAIGNGSYFPGLLVAFLAYATLNLVKSIEKRITKRSPYFEVEMRMTNVPGQLGKLGKALGDMKININSIEIKENGKELITIYLNLYLPVNLDKQEVIRKLMCQDGVYSIDQL